MKKFLYTILVCLSLFVLVGCVNNDLNSTGDIIEKIQENDKVDDNDMINIKVIINDTAYIADIEQNETTKELIAMLPLKLDMSDLNENEKYCYLNRQLPTDPYKPNTIEKGDIMLYGNDCLVVFYKSFKTSFSYTKIGHINDMPDLKGGSIVIELED